MATTQDEHNGNGTLRKFAFTFPYIKEDDVKVSLRTNTANVTTIASTNYTFPSATEIQFNALSGNATTFQETSGAPKNGVTVRVFRDTDLDTERVTFFPGSSIRAQDLNDNTLQNLYASQERQNRAVDSTGGSMTGNLSLNAADVVFEGATVGDGNKTTLTPATPSGERTITVPAVTGTMVTTGDSNTVTTTMVDGSLVDANIAAGAEIAVSKLADGDARQLLQTSANGNGVEWSSNLDVPGTLDVTGAVTLDNTLTVANNIDANGDLDVDGTTNLDAVDIDGNVHVQGTSTFVGAITASGGVTGDVTGNADTATNLAAAASVINNEQANHTVSDTTYFTTSASDARYFRQTSNETILDGATWQSSDAFIATTAAIDDRVIDLVDDVGGFVPIANETSFPAANPDVNNGAGTIVSIASIGTSRTPSNGTVTIANGQGSNNVIINNCGTTVLAQNYGCLVETTTTLNTYNFHRLVPRATEVTTVAGNNANISTVANNVADVNNFADIYQINNGDPTERADGSALVEGDLVYRSDTDVIRVYDGSSYSNITPDQATINDINIVADDLASFEDLGSIADDLVANQTGGALETCADNITDIRNLADIEDGTTATDAISNLAAIRTDVTACANRATEIGRLGTTDAVADMAILGTTDCVADMAILGTTDVVADLNLLATNDVVADMALLADADVIADMALLGTSDCVADMAILGTTDVVADLNTLATADIVSDMNTLATTANVNNMDTCADDISNINTVAGSIADVNRYANEYTIGTSAPGSPDQGDLWYDSNTGQTALKYFNGSSWITLSPGISDLSEDTSPEISSSASQLDMNSKNITEVGTISGNDMAMDFGLVTD